GVPGCPAAGREHPLWDARIRGAAGPGRAGRAGRPARGAGAAPAAARGSVAAARAVRLGPPGGKTARGLRRMARGPRGGAPAMGFYRLIEQRSRGARDYARLDPVKHSLVAALSRAAGHCPEGRWLDIGAGSGAYREVFAARARSYVGVDPAPRGPGLVRAP